jgi:site-specific recombinase XerD
MAAAKRRRVATGIYELERGVYELVVSRGRSPDGRYRQRTERFRGTLGDAKRARARLTTAVDDDPRSAIDPDAAMSFRDLLDRHLERMAAHGHSPRTLEDFGVHIRVHLGPALGNIPLDQLRTLDLDRLYDQLTTERGLRPATVRKIHNTARGALRQAVRWGLVSKNVAVDASPPTIRHTEIRVPSPAEVNKLLVEANEPFATLLRLAVATGMRRGELCALRWADVDLDGATVRVRAGLVMAHGRVYEKTTKTDRVRVLSLGASTIDALRAHQGRAAALARRVGSELKDDAFVFALSRPGSTEAYRPNRAVSNKGAHLNGAVTAVR